MEDSFKFRRDPFKPQPLTPGPLGYNDSASPDSKEEYRGETPGPLGMNDYADPNVNKGIYKRKRPVSVGADWDSKAAVAYLKDPKNGWGTFKSQGKCARAVRLAINAGHVATPRNPVSAADYKEYLPILGFVKVETEGYRPRLGDIAVFPAINGTTHVYGHIEMYNGERWQSDYLQSEKATDGKYGKGFFANDIWVSKPFTIFRR